MLLNRAVVLLAACALLFEAYVTPGVQVAAVVGGALLGVGAGLILMDGQLAVQWRVNDKNQ